MRWIPDPSGRFGQRPYYESDELNFECEALITAFLLARHGEIKYPIDTDDLTILLEQETSDLDLYADLSMEGDDVEGVTDFIPNAKPRVRIARELTEPRMANRLRTTLTHELGHVKLHSFLWAHDQIPLFSATTSNHSPRCRRESILGARAADWMEWQAGYASGAYLIPITPLRSEVRSVLGKAKHMGTVAFRSSLGAELISHVRSVFQVSEDAARVRLLQLGFLSENPVSPSLF